MSVSVTIPNKSHFKIDEVCGITGIKPYVLRFWESEFEEINPIFSSTGSKLFGHKDIDAILMIKNLLFEEKMSVEQVKREFFINPQLLDEQLIEDEESTMGCEDPILDDGVEVKNIFSEDQLNNLVAAQNKLQKIISITDGFNLT